MFLRIVAMVSLIGSISAHAQVSENTPVIEASGLSITKSDFEKMLSGDARLPLAMSQPSAKSALGTEFGKAFALEAEARRRQLDQDPAVQLKIRNYTQQLLANELLVVLRKGYLKDETLLARHYELHKDEYAQPRVRHILVRTKGSQVALRVGKPDLSIEQARLKADSLLAQLVKGADFAALAKVESDDAGSFAAGGDIGFVLKGATGANFEAAAYTSPVGQLSQVIQTEYGFHILRVEERRPMPLEMARAMIANELAHNELDGIILNGYKLNTAYFGK